jgi:hypothetical protein
MIEKERIELRFTLLLRDRARYLRKIGSDDLAELSDEEIALGDLLYDPRCVALALATPEERKALDAACWREVPAHLTLVARLERVVGPTFGRGDYDLRRALVMEGVAEALGRHNPELGGLAKLAAMTSYTKLRAWFSKGYGDHESRRRRERPRRIPAPAATALQRGSRGVGVDL